MLQLFDYFLCNKIMCSIELCHFGDHCEPGIIIDDILKQSKKCLFMLGVYNFNNIYKYLIDDDYEKNI
jgi:hypothetical protein